MNKIKVINAKNQRGWQAHNHLLDDSKMESLIGREYSTLAAMQRAAYRAAETFPFVEYELRGRRFEFDGSPQDIPGRTIQRIREII